MQEILINRCYGGFGLSDKVYEYLIKEKGWKVTEYSDNGFYVDESAKIVQNRGNLSFIKQKYDLTSLRSEENNRIDADIIEAVKLIGEKDSSGEFSDLKIIQIPNGVDWTIEEYDGIEWIAEKHRTWE